MRFALAPPNIIIAALAAWLAWGVGHRAPIEPGIKDLNDASTLPPSGNGYLTIGPGGMISAGDGTIQLCGPSALLKAGGNFTLTGMAYTGGAP